MKPPMHDHLILKQPKQPIVKDDQGFPEMIDIPVVGRAVQQSKLVKDTRGQERQATYTVMFPTTVTPKEGDLVLIGKDLVTILTCKARKSYSGKKTYYWVTSCGP